MKKQSVLHSFRMQGSKDNSRLAQSTSALGAAILGLGIGAKGGML